MAGVDLPVRPEFEFIEDVSVANWILDRLEPWDSSGVRVASFLPRGFGAYARIPNRWAPEDEALGEGSLPPEHLASLVAALAEGSVSTVTLLYWTGWGDWFGSSEALLTRVDREPTGLDKGHRLRRRRRQAVADHRALGEVPQIRAHSRAYFAFRAKLSAVSLFEIAGRYQSPSLWWGDDRAWCVATEVDSRYTFVGASHACVGRIKASATLEAADASLDDPISPRVADGSSGH
jgi:hypothetical protein